jgi:maleylacetoacetate isomerase
MSVALHGYWRSSATYRVRIGLALKGLDWDTRPVDLRAGGQDDPLFRALAPQGFVPVLTDGDTALAQSLAILEWLDERHASPPLLPGDATRRAQIRAAALAIACDIHPLNNLRVLRRLRQGLGATQETVEAWQRHWIELGFDALERIAETSTTLFREGITLADCCLVPQVYNARRVGMDVSAWPRLAAIDAWLTEQPAVARAHPDRAPDAG